MERALYLRLPAWMDESIRERAKRMDMTPQAFLRTVLADRLLRHQVAKADV